jgi:hypothetical protein
MENFRQLVKAAWWLMFAAMPFVLWHGIDEIFKDIGCPPQGDCYLPGWFAAFNLELYVMGFALLTWPACAWNLGVRWLAYRAFGIEPLRKLPGATSLGDSTGPKRK